MAFRVGQKVVCVDDHENEFHPQILKYGRVYEIAAFGEHSDCPGLSRLVMCLLGGNRADFWRDRLPFRAISFPPSSRTQNRHFNLHANA
jgi:hypothetical protein